MKKYLPKSVLAIVLGGLLVNCSHDDDWTSLVAGKLLAYEEVFKEEFGAIDPNQNWGFTSRADVTDGLNVTRGHDKNSNMWADEGWTIPDPLTDAQKDKVRRWFQQHKNPTGTAVNYTNFFVQQVYKGYTNLDGANSDCTEIYTAGNGGLFTGSNQMDKLTAGSIEDHINDFNNADRGEINVQNNDKSGEHYDAITLMVNSQTDCFGFYNSEESGQYNDHYVIIPGDEIQDWDSSGSSDADVSGMFFVGFDFESNKRAYNEDGTLNVNTNQYLVTETTEDDPNGVELPNDHSGKKYLIGGADGYYSDWIVRITEGIKSGTEEFVPDTDELPVDRTTSEVERIATETTTEYYENDQLVEQGRVFCEDLGKISTNDLDFNDVVFDAYIYEKSTYSRTIVKENDKIISSETTVTSREYYCRIVLLAAGGTLPLKVADKEVHDAFGHYSTTTIINTYVEGAETMGNEFATCDPVILGPYSYSSIAEIPITVFYDNGEILTLTASSGEAPHKIKVEVGTPWARERVKIDTAYPNFKKYVSESYDFWSNGRYEDGIYKHPKDTYQPLPMSDNSVLTSTDGPHFTYRDGNKRVWGGYDGETPVLSRKKK